MTVATATTAAPHGGHDLPVARPVRLARLAGVLCIDRHAGKRKDAGVVVRPKGELPVTRLARTIRAGPPM